MMKKVFSYLLAILVIGSFVYSAVAQHNNHDHETEAHTEAHHTEAHGHDDAHADHMAHGEEHAEDGGFNVGEVLMHHIMDAHELHVFSIGDFHGTLPLPIILYNTDRGSLDMFMSSKFEHGHASYKGYAYHHGALTATDGSKFYDISITKNVFMMFVSVVLLCLIFMTAAKGYKKRAGKAPKGIQSVVEPLIIFVRDEIANPMIGKHKAARFMPYLLTVFFFVWINNLLGLLPGLAANVTGNIAITLVLASFTFVIVNFSGNKHYWAHVFYPSGVPVAMLPIMWIVEIAGLFVKPAALCIRMFANITAGHLIILSIISLIFIFGQLAPAAGYGVSLVSIGFGLFMMCLELLVAALQAYIFTMLSALFISDAVQDGHH